MNLPKFIPATALAVVLAGCGQTTVSEDAAKKAPAPTATPTPAPTSYEATIQKFQSDREAALRRDTGWLTVAGIFFLSEPSTTFGSDPVNDIVLPEGAPGYAGTFEVRNGKVSVKAAPGVALTLGDKTVTSADLKSDAESEPDRIGVGRLQLWVHMSGRRLSIRLRDPNSQLLKDFTGTQWFPIRESYRVEARYVPYAKAKIVQVANILGDIDDMPIPGEVTFTLNGQEITMQPVAEPGDDVYWFIFRDMTSGKESYGAARFLYADAPVNGKMIIDFNMAQNPPCAYNPFTTCPLPPEQNRLRLRVEAGEKAYSH